MDPQCLQQGIQGIHSPQHIEHVGEGGCVQRNCLSMASIGCPKAVLNFCFGRVTCICGHQLRYQQPIDVMINIQLYVEQVSVSAHPQYQQMKQLCE